MPPPEPEWLHLGDAEALKKHADGFYQTIEALEAAAPMPEPLAKSAKALEQVARDLASAWWQPIAAHLPPAAAAGGKKPLVCLSPDGIAHRIPFAALPVGSGFVAASFDLRQVSSARDFLRESPSSVAKGTAVIIGNPALGDMPAKAHEPSVKPANPTALQSVLAAIDLTQMPDLPSAAAEATELTERARAAGWKVELTQGTEATEQQLFKISQPALLHIAAHGLDLLTLAPVTAPGGMLARDPMQASLLLLAGARPSLAEWQSGRQPDPATDGILTAHEAAALDLQGTLLVTASCCWSGSGGLKSGEGVMGLRRAFAQAGARHSLLSLWPVDDETTKQMMGSFYEQLFGGQNPPTAWSVT